MENANWLGFQQKHCITPYFDPTNTRIVDNIKTVVGRMRASDVGKLPVTFVVFTPSRTVYSCAIPVEMAKGGILYLSPDLTDNNSDSDIQRLIATDLAAIVLAFKPKVSTTGTPIYTREQYKEIYALLAKWDFPVETEEHAGTATA